MPTYVGVDVDAVLHLAQLLEDAALELRGCAAMVASPDGDDGSARLQVLTVAEWAEREADDLRQRAAAAHTYDLIHGVRSPWGIGGGQRGWNNKRLSDEERARLQELLNDPTATKKAKNAAEKKLQADAKSRGDRGSTLNKEAKTPPRPAAGDDGVGEVAKNIERPAEYAAAGAASGAALWWLGKLLSPACGPAVLLCAAIG